MCELEPGTGIYQECEPEIICESEVPLKYYIDWEDPSSLYNMVQTLDLMCTPEEEIQRISTIYYIGEIVGGLLISRIPDLFGRKYPLLISTALQFPVFLGILLSRSLTLTYVLGFFLGILHIGIYNGGYINICEYVHNTWKNIVCTVLLAFDMVSLIIVGLYFRYVSDDWTWVMVLAISLNGFSIFGLYFVPESPEYLYSFYRFKECREIIFKISRWNGVIT